MGIIHRHVLVCIKGNFCAYILLYMYIYIYVYMYIHIYTYNNVYIYIYTGNLQHVLASPCYAGAISSLQKLTCEFPVPHAIKKVSLQKLTWILTCFKNYRQHAPTKVD